MDWDLDRQFLAKDAYREWKRRVRAAVEEVRVFSPYLDRLVVDLLGNARLDASALSVVTDLSPASGSLDFRGRLLSIRRLLQKGIEVRSLARLHAKVLLVDGCLATVGSQNFTSYARKSKETTAAPSVDLAGSNLLATLAQWYKASEPVVLDDVERLLSLLDEPLKHYHAAHDDLMAAFYRAEEERRRELAGRLARDGLARAKNLPVEIGIEAAVRRTRYRTGQVRAWARLQWVGYEYQTLMAERDADLTWWKAPVGRVTRDVHLQPLHFYPLILSPSGQMAVVRVARTRITYVWRGVTWGVPRSVGNRRLWLDVAFPESGLDEANLLLRVRHQENSPRGYEVALRFDGQEVLLTGQRMLGSPGPFVLEQLRSACDQAFSDEEQRAKLLRDVFDSFSPRRVGIDKHNADKFFSSAWHQLDLIDFLDRKILVARPT